MKPIEANIILPKDAGWEDLDIGDDDDPLMVSEYVNEVYDYLRVVEVLPFR